MTVDELQKLIDKGEILYTFDVFHGKYAYKKDEMLSKDKMVFEMHYTMIDDLKKLCSEMISIYILPSKISQCVKNLKDRHLDKKSEKEREKEIKEQYNRFLSDKKIYQKTYFIII